MTQNEWQLGDTIFALATPYAMGAIHIIRVSGPKAFAIVQALSVKPLKKQGFIIQRNKLVDKQTNTLIDDVLLMTYVAPKSYTGEDLIEINCHGSLQIVQTIFSLLTRSGARPATPGEFTRRGFMNQKLTLSQAAAVDLLVKAKSPQVQAYALNALQTNNEQLRQWQEMLLDLIGKLEVSIDYPDTLEGQTNVESASSTIKVIANKINSLLEQTQRVKQVNDGIKVAIIGRPNVGKSSLLNVLSGRERALVSAIPGTTRDVIESTLVINGFALTLLDTAGMRTKSQSNLEQQGIKLTNKTFNAADIVIIVRAPNPVQPDEITEKLIQRLKRAKKPFLVCVNKSDLIRKKDRTHFGDVVFSSAKNNDVKELVDRLTQLLSAWQLDVQAHYVLSAQWQSDLLAEALNQLNIAQKAACETPYPEIVVEPLKQANTALLKVMAKHVDYDLLDEIFKRFCLGK